MPLHQQQVGPLIQFTFSHKVPGAAIQTSEVNWFRLEDTLIDAGSEPASAELLKILHGNPPSQIILTHQHEDHVGGVPALRQEFGNLPIHAPEEHISILEEGYPVPDYRRNFWGRMLPFQGMIPYRDGHTFNVGPYTLHAKDTPGHTVGHKAIYFEADRLYVISGDLYLAPRLPNALYETSVPDLIDSLQWLLNLKEKFVLLPSHGGPYEDGPRRIKQLLEWYIRQRDEILELHQKHPKADYREIFKIRHGYYNRMEIHSGGELSRLALIRGVLEPVQELPAPPIQLEAELLKISKEKLGLT
ncbi:MAG: MBL fold metallo-hydrolase [Leptospiraceae bacterium]|nr:MBL fold metallo-hydrolase [Leptospiraceae bacterium]